MKFVVCVLKFGGDLGGQLCYVAVISAFVHFVRNGVGKRWKEGNDLNVSFRTVVQEFCKFFEGEVTDLLTWFKSSIAVFDSRECVFESFVVTS